MALNDSFVQVAPDGAGKKIDNAQLSVAPKSDPQNANTVYRQRTVISDNDDANGLLPVQATPLSQTSMGAGVRLVPDKNFERLTQETFWRQALAKLDQIINAASPVNLSDAPVISNMLESALMTAGGVLVQPQFAFANIAASQTDSSIVPAVGGKIIRIASFRLLAGATATNFTFNSKPIGSAGIAISETFACAINGGFSSGFSQVGHFQTKVSEGLTATTGAGSTVGVGIVYVLVPVFALPPLL